MANNPQWLRSLRTAALRAVRKRKRLHARVGRPERPIRDLDESTPTGRLGIALRRARQRAGLTLTMAAARAGVSLTRLSRWERGVRSPPAELLPTLAMTLGCELGDLFA